MKDTALILALLPVLSFASLNYSFSQEYSAVTLPTTIVREIESDYVKDMTYELYVDLPPGYDTSGKTYPVVYLTDAETHLSGIGLAYSRAYRRLYGNH
jgi:hypothetical protein